MEVSGQIYLALSVLLNLDDIVQLVNIVQVQVEIGIYRLVVIIAAAGDDAVVYVVLNNVLHHNSFVMNNDPFAPLLNMKL